MVVVLSGCAMAAQLSSEIFLILFLLNEFNPNSDHIMSFLDSWRQRQTIYTMKLSSLFTSTILRAKYISRRMREPRHIGFQQSQKQIFIRYGNFPLCPTIVSAFLIHDLVERIQSGDVAKKVSSMK